MMEISIILGHCVLPTHNPSRASYKCRRVQTFIRHMSVCGKYILTGDKCKNIDSSDFNLFVVGLKQPKLKQPLSVLSLYSYTHIRYWLDL